MNDPDSKAEIEATVELTPRGDLIERLADFLDSKSQARIVTMPDPVSGAMGVFQIARDADGNQEVGPLPASMFDDYLDAPRFRRGTSKLTSIDSFIAHTNRFKDGDSAVFACDDRANPSLTAVLDYHQALDRPEAPDDEPPGPRFGLHRSTFAFPLSDEWKAWNKMNATPMDIPAFAAFLEDRIADIAAPGEVPLSKESDTYIERIGGRDQMATPTDLVVLSRGLRINENAAITDERKLASGEANLTFSTEHTDADGAPLRIPTSFIIAIPVFRNDGFYGVVARLRYRPRPSLSFFYELHVIDRVFDHAFDMATDKVASETGLPVFRGAPEA